MQSVQHQSKAEKLESLISCFNDGTRTVDTCPLITNTYIVESISLADLLPSNQFQNQQPANWIFKVKQDEETKQLNLKRTRISKYTHTLTLTHPNLE